MVHPGLQGCLQLLRKGVTVRIDETQKQRQSLSADTDTEDLRSLAASSDS